MGRSLLAKVRTGSSRKRESALFIAILILKWYLMSHQARTDLSDGREHEEREKDQQFSVGLAIVVRIHTCVFVRLCCRCQPLLYHTGVQTTVSSYRMVHHGVSVTYTLFGYPASQPHLFLSLSLCLLQFRMHSPARGSCRTVAPTTKMFCETQTFVSARSTDRETPSPEGGDDNRRPTFPVFVITPRPTVHCTLPILP